jgi:hypothetical protein
VPGAVILRHGLIYEYLGPPLLSGCGVDGSSSNAAAAIAVGANGSGGGGSSGGGGGSSATTPQDVVAYVLEDSATAVLRVNSAHDAHKLLLHGEDAHCRDNAAAVSAAGFDWTMHSRRA